MGTRRRRCAVVGCVLVVIVAGWAGPSRAAGRTPVPPKEWLTDVCSATRAWVREVERAATQAQESFADEALTEGPLTALLRFLGVAAEATQTLTAAAEDAGVPDGRGGRDVARTLVQTLDAVETGFRDTQRDLAPLRASTDPAAIATGVAGARARVDAAISTGLGALDDAVGSGALARTAIRVRACRAISG